MRGLPLPEERAAHSDEGHFWPSRAASADRRPGDRARLEGRLRDDRGSMLPLTIFYGFLCIVLVLLVVAATSLYLERKRLFTLADGAALVGAEAFDLDDVESTPEGLRATLESPDVAAAAAAYLRTAPTSGFESLTLEKALTADGRSATVELSAYWRPPLVSALVPEGLRIEVTAVARSVFSR